MFHTGIDPWCHFIALARKITNKKDHIVLAVWEWHIVPLPRGIVEFYAKKFESKLHERCQHNT